MTSEETKSEEGFPKTRAARRNELARIIKSGTQIGTKKIPGRNGGNKPVFRIPLSFLSYNPYNTRFLSEAKTLEGRLGKLSDENPDHIKYIEKFLWEWKVDKNKSTIDSLIANGQLDPGVVTRDGIILSGNRRFRLLNEINRNKRQFSGPGKNLDGLDYFEAVIIDEELSPKDIIKYESFYQYGTEEKVDYNPIEKYIAVKDQKDLGFTEDEIFSNFQALAKEKKKITEWLETFQLMNQYLNHIGEPGVYTALTSTEEAFLNINSNVKSLENGRSATVRRMWNFDELDIADFKMVAFNYIRNGMQTHRFRDLFKTFQNETAWKEFKKEHDQIMQSDRVDSFDDYRKNNPSLDESEVSKKRTLDYRDKYEKKLNKAFGSEVTRQMVEKEDEQPFDLLKGVLQKLEKFEKYVEGHGALNSHEDDCVGKLREIQSLSGRLKQRLD